MNRFVTYQCGLTQVLVAILAKAGANIRKYWYNLESTCSMEPEISHVRQAQPIMSYASPPMIAFVAKQVPSNPASAGLRLNRTHNQYQLSIGLLTKWNHITISILINSIWITIINQYQLETIEIVIHCSLQWLRVAHVLLCRLMTQSSSISGTHFLHHRTA